MSDTPALLIDPLLISLPALLVHLLDQAKGESLERLQLLSCTLECDAQFAGGSVWQEVKIERLKEERDHFLILSGEIHHLRISLRYFVRGVKKYFRLPEQEFRASSCPWRFFDHQWVKSRLIELGQDNPLFYDEKLAELNGRKEVLVPSHLLLGEALKEAMVRFSEHFPKKLQMEFHKSIKLGEAVSITDFQQSDLSFCLVTDALAMRISLVKESVSKATLSSSAFLKPLS